jgi:hypothetical protein
LTPRIFIMPSTSFPEFNAQTEGLDVAKTFAPAIQGKTIIVTGVNLGGIGFSAAEAFVSRKTARRPK